MTKKNERRAGESVADSSANATASAGSVTRGNGDSVRHTPGPWAVNPFKAQVDAFDIGEPLPVCQLLWPTELRTEAVTEANAHLIAAAPECLEALRALRLRLHFVGMPQEPRRDDGRPDWRPEIALMEAAIAKAEGR